MGTTDKGKYYPPGAMPIPDWATKPVHYLTMIGDQVETGIGVIDITTGRIARKLQVDYSGEGPISWDRIEPWKK